MDSSLLFAICFMFCGRAEDAPRRFFEFRPRHHDKVSAAFAFQSEVHARARDFPFAAAAWMRFFHADDIPDLVLLFFHAITLFISTCCEELCI